MAVAIRLRREGNKNRPFFRIVVTDSRARRDGNFIEQIGTYDPLVEGKNFTIDLEKVDKWVGDGAQPFLSLPKVGSGISESAGGTFEPGVKLSWSQAPYHTTASIDLKSYDVQIEYYDRDQRKTKTFSP